MNAPSAAFLMLQPSDARPGTLERIPHRDVQRAAAFAGELDLVTIHERVEPAVISPSRQNIARLERMDGRYPLDAARNLVRHVVGIEVLIQGAVIGERDLQLVRIPDLVLGDDVGADGREVSRDFIW